MKTLILSIFALACSSVAGGTDSNRCEDIDLVAHDAAGKTVYSIVVRKDAGPCEAYAAAELQAYLRKISGTELPIVTDERESAGKGIYLGRTRFTDHLASGTDYAKLGPDGFRLKVTDGNFVLAADTPGKPGAGVLYGVYETLERFGGCGWYASWHEVVPQATSFCVPSGLDEAQTPAFDLRQPTWYDVHLNRVNGYRNKTNPPLRGGPQFGGSRHFFAPHLGNCHTFDWLVPPKEHFAKHPEYYCEVNGERKPSQLCLSNPDVLRICLEKVRASLKENYPKGIRYYGVSQNDGNQDYCRCPKCKALDDAEGTPFASILTFVNAIAADIEKDYPEAVIETLAYDYSSTPPKTMKFRDNVMPCVCTIKCDFSKPFRTSRYPKNVATAAELKRWGEITKRFYVWDYTTDFAAYMYPFANVRSLRENVRTFRDCGVTMLYEQGAWQGIHGDWAELKAWLLAKYLWNPDYDEETLLGRFFTNFYGPAAPVMRQAFDELHALPRDETVQPLRVGEKIESGIVPDEFLDRQAALYSTAMKLAKGTPYARNVSYQFMSADVPRLVRYFASPDYGVYFCSRHPERIDRDRHARMLKAAKRVLRVVDEPKMTPTVLAEGKGHIYLAAIRTFAGSALPDGPCDRLTIPDGLLGIGGPTGYAVRVEDPKAEDGWAVRYSDVSYIWMGDFDFSTVMTDPDGVYKVRVRLRVQPKADAPADGEVFWAGIYNQIDAKASIGDLSLKVKDIPDGEYHWYDLAEWTPRKGDHLWSGGGRFKDNRANHDGCWVDGFELVRVR